MDTRGNQKPRSLEEESREQGDDGSPVLLSAEKRNVKRISKAVQPVPHSEGIEMKAFCECGRIITWERGIPVCECKRVLEPQTEQEFEARKREHVRELLKITESIVKFASVIAFFCLTMPLCAQAPAPSDEAKVVLVAPSEARIGELVRFDASESNADSFKWRLVPDSPDFESYAEGSKAVFSARSAGEYLFILAVAKGGDVDVITHVVKVAEPPSAPVNLTLAEWIPYLLWEHSYPMEERHAVAAVFDSIASRAYELPTPADWIRTTAEMNRAALGERLTAWIPILDKIGEILGSLSEQGMISPEQHAAVWREIAQLLRK